MSLSTALNIAQGSLLNTQRQTTVVSRNIANAYNEDYSRRTAILSSLAPGSRVAEVRRTTDAALFKQNLSALSGWTAQSTMVSGLDRLNLSVNGVDNTSSPAAMLGRLQQAIQLYSSTPTNRTLAENAVEAARDMVRTLNDGTYAIQSMRAELDSEIALGVAELNSLLVEFQSANDEIIRATTSGRDALDTYDRRDALLKKIAEIVPISTIDRANNDLMIVTADGATLFESTPRHVHFESTPAYNASDTGQRILIDGVPMALASGANTNGGGTLSALVQLRDEYTTGLQAQFDEIARGLIVAFSEVVPADDTTPEHTLAGLFVWDTSSTMPADGVRTDGLAGMIALNSKIDPQKNGDPQKIRDGINHRFNPGPELAPYGNFTERLNSYMSALDTQMDFKSADDGNVSLSLMTYSTSTISWLEGARKAAAFGAESKSALVVRTTEALSNITRVNIDEEMALMLELEQSYAASAKMLQMLDEMLKTLLGVVR